ncbi:PAS domain S-box protein [Sphingomonas sp. AP4-R1]|uniref:PAS domain-containing sensor histidine kinase n=1 Tax=Sphingomonas sp. AP4-R1 TaxID=2735134 RepID=UPI001493CA06|nr:PAS domain S-box protein [Sphingomonas sp. AP4-R1]QJU58265.1 PAS domain S-box protein [Sphingomonas sp. AP4-R1]
MDKKDSSAPDVAAEVKRLAPLLLRQVGGYVLLLLDPAGRVLSYNEEGERIECWPLDRVLGNAHDLFYPPDEITAGRPQADLSAALHDGTFEREAWRVCENGSEYLARLTITALLDGDMHCGFACITRDITDDAAVRASIETREQHLQSILATVPDAMIIIDEVGSITSFSAAAERLFGYREAELIGRNVSCLMPQPDRDRHDEYISHYLHTGERRIIGIGRVVVGERKDGTTFPMELSVGEAGEDGHRVFTGFIRDLTAKEEDELKLKELQAELVHVSRLSAMGTMASTLAHELNQPLAAVALYLETVRDLFEELEDERFADLRAVMNDAAQETLRAGHIVRRLRDFVARGEVDKNLVAVPGLIEEAGQLALVGARERGVRSFFTYDPAATPVLVDRVQIQQVLVNLIRNAVEAMASSPIRDLRVATHLCPDGFIEVTIEDSGPGILEEVRARLFEAFVSTKAGGMGLGLSICRTIVEAHGGRIWVEDPAGGGTRFHFTLIHARAEDNHGG